MDLDNDVAGLDLDDEEVDEVGELVKLISQEGHEFIVSRDCVLASGTIRAMLTGPGLWQENAGPIPTINFESISTPILEKAIQYFYYKRKYDHTTPPLPTFEIDVETIVPLLLAANFLDT